MGRHSPSRSRSRTHHAPRSRRSSPSPSRSRSRSRLRGRRAVNHPAKRSPSRSRSRSRDRGRDRSRGDDAEHRRRRSPSPPRGRRSSRSRSRSRSRGRGRSRRARGRSSSSSVSRSRSGSRSSSGSGSSGRSVSPSRSRSRSRGRGRGAGRGSDRTQDRKRGASTERAKDSSRKTAVAHAVKEETKPVVEKRQGSVDKKTEVAVKTPEGKTEPKAEPKTKTDAAEKTRSRADSEEAASMRKRQRSPSAEDAAAVVDRGDAEREQVDAKRRHVESTPASSAAPVKEEPSTKQEEVATPPRRERPAKRTSEDRTPPHNTKSGRSTREKKDSLKKERKQTTKTKRGRRRRSRDSSSSSGSSESSSSGSDSGSGSSSDTSADRTPPRRSRKKREEPVTPERNGAKKNRAGNTRDGVSTPRVEGAVRANRPNILLDDVKGGRAGGIYIPPFKLAQMRRDEKKDPDSESFQRQTWEALRKSINGLINKVNVTNIGNLIPELFQENLVRGRGILARSIMKAQLASPGFTHIYAGLLAVLNTKLPECGELVVKRVVYRFPRAFKRGDKVVAIALVRFIAHLVNQQIVHELLALEVLTLLLANPTDDSVEVAVNFTKECGQILTELCPEGLRAIFERFRGILHEGEIDKRVQYTIEGLFAIRKGGFADYPAVHEQLDLVEAGDQITHEIALDDDIDREDKLDIFRFDPEFEKNEAMWTAIKKEILGESDSDSDSDGSSGSDGSDEESDDEEGNGQGAAVAMDSGPIQDMTEQDLVNLRRTIYLTIMSSISHEECAHKLLKINIRPGQEKEICNMLIECCSQERTYLRYFGLLGQRFCLIKREYQDAFDECFAEQYSLIHRLETNKLRNVAKFFAHLLFSDGLPWTVFEYIRLNEEDTTSSSRIFIKILCQELSEHIGMKKLKERLLDPIMEQTFSGLFPKDNPRNTRFAINFFTSIGLGGLTTELREYLKNAPKMIMAQSAPAENSDSDSDSDSSSSSSSSSSGSSSGSSGSSSDSDSSSSDSD